MEHAQVRRLVPMNVPGWRVIAQGNDIHALQAHDANRLWPAPIIADAKTDLCVHGPPDLEAVIADVEEFFLQMLKGRFGLVLRMAGQVDLAIASDDAPGPVHQDGGIESLTAFGELGIAEVKANAEFFGFVEQWAHRGIRHRLLEKAFVSFCLLHPVAREKRGERQFREHHTSGTASGSVAQQGKQALHNRLARVREMNWSHLRYR